MRAIDMVLFNYGFAYLKAVLGLENDQNMSCNNNALYIKITKRMTLK